LPTWWISHLKVQESLSRRAIVKKNKNLAGLREEQKVFDVEVEAARAQQAKTRAAVMQQEKNMKKTEKTLEGKLFLFFLRNHRLIEFPIIRGPNWSPPKPRSSMLHEK